MNTIKIVIGIMLAVLTMSSALAYSSYWYDDYHGGRNVNYNINGWSNSGTRGTAVAYTYPQIGYNYPQRVHYRTSYDSTQSPYNRYYGGSSSYANTYRHNPHNYYTSSATSYRYNPYTYRSSYSYRPTSTGISNYARSTRNSYGYGSYGGYASGYHGDIRTGTYGGASQPVLFDGRTQEYTGYNRYY